MIFALRKFHIYLLSTQTFLLRTAHKEMSYEFQKKEIHGHLDRCLEILAEYDLKVQYKTGRFNKLADGLSKRPSVSLPNLLDEGDLVTTLIITKKSSNFGGLEEGLQLVGK